MSRAHREAISGVYVIQLKNTDKYYVGKSNDIDKRIKSHKECNEIDVQV